MQLSERNGITLSVSYGVVTVGSSHLSTAYIDKYHAELDRLQAAAQKIRTDALEASKDQWGDVDIAKMLAVLVVAIEAAEDTTDEDGVVTCAIDNLRDGEVFESVLKETLPVSMVMGASGASHRLRSIEREIGYHNSLSRLWRLACTVELSGDISAYFGDGHQWPAIKGSMSDRYAALDDRCETLSVVAAGDLRAMFDGLDKHLDAANGLTEAEEGN